MARLDGNMQSFAIGRGGFAFTGARLDRLGASNYTLATLMIDVTGSVDGFQDQLRDMAIQVVESCRFNPMSDNIMLRLALFSSMFAKGINEIHGFTPLRDIDTASYPKFRPGGMTPLNDACYSGIGATNAYAKQLADNDYGVNGLLYVVTDGGENASVATMQMVRDEQQKVVKSETLESMISILVGINTANCLADLQRFQNDAGITHFIDGGQATKSNLAKIAGHISHSISSQSQALGTGGPSQNISATI